MVTVAYGPHVEKTIGRIRDRELKERGKTQIVKIVNNPSIGKPLRYSRKQTREVYIPPFRLSCLYDKRNDTLVFLSLITKTNNTTKVSCNLSVAKTGVILP